MVRNGPSTPSRRTSPAAPDVDGHDAQPALDLVEADVVDPDDLVPLDVDDLLVQQVGPQQDLVLALAELRDVDRVDAQPGAGVVERLDAVQGRKIWRRSVRATSPVTGGYRSPMATMRSAIVPIGSPCGSRTGRPMHWLRKRMVATCGRVRPPSVTGLGAARRAACRQGAGRTRLVPAGAPAGLGPVSTGERSSCGVGRPERRGGWRGRVSVVRGGEARSNGPCGGPGAYHRPMPILRVALVQLEARDDVDDNIARAAALADEAADGADLVVLPEYVQYRGTDAGFRASARPIPGPTTAPFEAVARAHGTWILAGSHAEASADPGRPVEHGRAHRPRTAGSRRPTASSTCSTSRWTTGRPTPSRRASCPATGRSSRTSTASGLGLSICYDLRFPELYRALSLAGAAVLAVPAVFTERTGRDHWEVLLRARAIENGAWVIAAAGCGRGGPGAIPAWGHSMVVDPWGRIVAEAGKDEGIVRAELDLDAVDAARRQIPVLANRRPEALPPARSVERVEAPGAVPAER